VSGVKRDVGASNASESEMEMEDGLGGQGMGGREVQGQPPSKKRRIAPTLVTGTDGGL
jgi:hypothetical protein